MELPIRLLLVDDEARVRQGLRMCMAGEPDFDVIGEAAEGSSAVHMAEELHPDVVVMDVRMAGLDGIGAAREMRTHAPGSHIVMLSLHDDTTTREEATEAGAAAFVGKQEGIARLFDVIRSIARNTDNGCPQPA
jgi:DNA-binding NarL/FixJ family response regulator